MAPQLDSRRMMQAGAYVISGGIEARPLISYLLENGGTARSKLEHDLFYFGAEGLNHHLNQLFQLHAIDIGMGRDEIVKGYEEKMKVGSSNLTMLQILDGVIDGEIKNQYGSGEGKLRKKKDFLECVDENFYMLVNMSMLGNTVDYQKFLKLGNNMKYPERLHMKHLKVLDFRYKDSQQTAVLEGRAHSLIHNIVVDTMFE
jgi:hypothetical protein